LRATVSTESDPAVIAVADQDPHDAEMSEPENVTLV
jgi:hypothetical protein